MRPQEQLGAESRADKGRVDGDTLGRQAEDLRDGIAMDGSALGGFIEMQIAALPPRQRGVHFHRVMGFDRGTVDGVDLDGRLVECRRRLAARMPSSAIAQAVRLDAVFQVSYRLGAGVGHLDAVRRLAGVLERVGHDQCHHLPAVVDGVVLERQAVFVGDGRGQDRRARDRALRNPVEPREVAVVQDVGHAGHAARVGRLDAGDAAARHGAVHAVGVQHAGQRAIRRIEGGAGDLEPAVDAARRRADSSVVHARTPFRP
ncbi:hypothetical protein D3C81_728360 [compost metagenome]